MADALRTALYDMERREKRNGAFFSLSPYRNGAYPPSLTFPPPSGVTRTMGGRFFAGGEGQSGFLPAVRTVGLRGRGSLRTLRAERATRNKTISPPPRTPRIAHPSRPTHREELARIALPFLLRRFGQPLPVPPSTLVSLTRQSKLQSGEAASCMCYKSGGDGEGNNNNFPLPPHAI